MENPFKSPFKIWKIDKDLGLFYLRCSDGITCLSYYECKQRVESLYNELGLEPCIQDEEDTFLVMYSVYVDLTGLARVRHGINGWKSQSRLIPELIGHEGKWYTTVDSRGLTHWFKLGISEGAIPGHVLIKPFQTPKVKVAVFKDMLGHLKRMDNLPPQTEVDPNSMPSNGPSAPARE